MPPTAGGGSIRRTDAAFSPLAYAPPPSPSQSDAIAADPQPLLVLAGPGAGKTYCLIERIRFLIERHHYDPSRICAFTFTNKAAGEIAERLERQLGARAEVVKRGTIHAFCAELLREFGSHVDLAPGFGIADEEYQRSVLWRLRVPPRWHGRMLNNFGLHRYQNQPFEHGRDEKVFAAYERFLHKHNLVDFDQLVIKTADLLLRFEDVRAAVRGRWNAVLVDEFQDLSRPQYVVVRELAHVHRNIFAVGDDEQSIFSWAGADPKVFGDFMNDFGIGTQRIHLRDNRRCPRTAFGLARRLVMLNPQLFEDRPHPEPERDSPFPVVAHSFPDEDSEIAWVVDDLRRHREQHGLEWGDFAVLYRKHGIGDAVEARCLADGVPCRLAQGRALADDPVVAYVLAALRVIAHPNDEVNREQFLAAILPRALIDAIRAKALEEKSSLYSRARRLGRDLPRHDADGRKLRRGLIVLQNLAVLGARHAAIMPLVEELLSQRVGRIRSILEEHHDDLTDPAGYDHVVALARRLRAAIDADRPVWIPRLGGVEIPLHGILAGIGVRRVPIGGAPPAGADCLTTADGASLGMALGVFKAAQLVATEGFENAFRDFTCVDLETTSRDIDRAEIVQIAAVRVRGEQVVAEFHEYVCPRVPIESGATATHGLRAEDLTNAPYFEDVWPRFRDFCGDDLLVAHNGYLFDFPILRRMAGTMPGGSVYDTLPLARDLLPTSRKLRDLARGFGIDSGQSHHALDDTRTLARVFVALNDAKLARARKTALVNLLDHLGVALALGDEDSLSGEARLLKDLAAASALGRYSDCLEFYRVERERLGDASLPTVEQVIDRLGGPARMLRIRAERTADQRYPAAMLRLRRLLAECGDPPLASQIETFLERAVLSRQEGAEPDRERVNLLTLHSTKGLEFSRVYILGVEDAQLPGGKAPTASEIEEARRLLYVGMTRVKDRLILTRAQARGEQSTGGHRFLDEMDLIPRPPA